MASIWDQIGYAVGGIGSGIQAADEYNRNLDKQRRDDALNNLNYQNAVAANVLNGTMGEDAALKNYQSYTGATDNPFHSLLAKAEALKVKGYQQEAFDINKEVKDPQAAKALWEQRHPGESLGSVTTTSTAQVPVVKATPEGRQFSPINADMSPVMAPLTTAKTQDAWSLLASPKSSLTEVSAGASLFDPKTGKSVFTAPQRTEKYAGMKIPVKVIDHGATTTTYFSDGTSLTEAKSVAPRAAGSGSSSMDIVTLDANGNPINTATVRKGAKIIRPTKATAETKVMNLAGKDGPEPWLVNVKTGEPIRKIAPESAFERTARLMEEAEKRRRGGR